MRCFDTHFLKTLKSYAETNAEKEAVLDEKNKDSGFPQFNDEPRAPRLREKWRPSINKISRTDTRRLKIVVENSKRGNTAKKLRR